MTFKILLSLESECPYVQYINNILFQARNMDLDIEYIDYLDELLFTMISAIKNNQPCDTIYNNAHNTIISMRDNAFNLYANYLKEKYEPPEPTNI